MPAKKIEIPDVFWMMLTRGVNYRISVDAIDVIIAEYKEKSKNGRASDPYALIEFEDISGEPALVPVCEITQFFKSTPEQRAVDWLFDYTMRKEKKSVLSNAGFDETFDE